MLGMTNDPAVESELTRAQATIVGDIGLLGVALDVTNKDSRVGWFGRGLSLEEPVTPRGNQTS